MFKKSMLSLFVMVALVAGMNAANAQAVPAQSEASVNVKATVAPYKDIQVTATNNTGLAIDPTNSGQLSASPSFAVTATTNTGATVSVGQVDSSAAIVAFPQNDSSQSVLVLSIDPLSVADLTKVAKDDVAEVLDNLATTNVDESVAAENNSVNNAVGYVLTGTIPSATAVTNGVHTYTFTAGQAAVDYSQTGDTAGDYSATVMATIQ